MQNWFNEIISAINSLTGEVTKIAESIASINELKNNVVNQVVNLSGTTEDTLLGSDNVKKSVELADKSVGELVDSFNELKDTMEYFETHTVFPFSNSI